MLSKRLRESNGSKLWLVFRKILLVPFRFVARLQSVLNVSREYYHWLLVRTSRKLGVTEEKRSPALIVSLTTIPERIHKVSICINSLLQQDLKPDQIILWLSESRERGRPLLTKDSLPIDLRGLVSRGLDIRWCADTGSSRKLLPALEAFPDALIVTADDDLMYPRSWLADLHRAHVAEPDYVHCHRGHWMRYQQDGKLRPYLEWDLLAYGKTGPSFDLFPTTGAGVIYGPGHLDPEVLNVQTMVELCPKADDVWFKAMTVLAGVRCSKISKRSSVLRCISTSPTLALNVENEFGGGNDRQLDAVANRYPVFRKEKSQRAEVVFEYAGKTINLRGHSVVDLIFRDIEEELVFYEIDLLEYIAYAVGQRVGCIVDVGANIGNHSVFFGVLMNRDVICFEPNPEVYPLLVHNLESNGVRHRSFDIGLGEQAGQFGIVADHIQAVTNMGAAKLQADAGGTIAGERLDDVLGEKLDLDSPIAAIKIDIEGMEAEMLRGSVKTIQSYRPEIFVEAMDHTALQMIEEILVPLGYVRLYQHASTPVWHFAHVDFLSLKRRASLGFYQRRKTVNSKWSNLTRRFF